VAAQENDQRQGDGQADRHGQTADQRLPRPGAKRIVEYGKIARGVH